MKASLRKGATLVLAPTLRLAVNRPPAQADGLYLHTAFILGVEPALVGPYQCTSDEKLSNVAGYWTGSFARPFLPVFSTNSLPHRTA